MNMRRRLSLLLFFATLLFAGLGQYYFARVRERPLDGIAFYLAAVLCFILLLQRGEAKETAPAGPSLGRLAWESVKAHPERAFLFLICLVLAYTAIRQNDLGEHRAALWFWVASMLAYVAASVRLPPFADQDLSSLRAFLRALRGKLRESGRRLARGIREHRWEILFVAGCTVAGLVLRLYRVDQVPYLLSGDEGAMGLEARRVLSGELKDPFATGWLSHPTLYFFLLARGLHLYGPSAILSLRCFSPLAGTLTLPLIYLLARRILDRQVATVAIVLLTVSHFHIHFSRLGINNIYDATFALLALLLLVYGLDGDRPGSPLLLALSGLSLGLSMYFYMGSRLIPLMVGAYILLLAVRRQLSPRSGGGRLLLLLGGFLVAFAPLLLFAVRHPVEYMGRVQWISMLEPGRIAEIQMATGKSAWYVWWMQLRKSFLAFNYQLDPTSWYAAPIPLLDAVSAAAMILGLTVAMRKWKERSYLLLNLWFWLAIFFGGVLLENPPTSPRLIIAAPVVCLLAAVGIVSLGRALASLLRRGELWEAALRVLLVGLIVVMNVSFYFFSYTPSGIFGGLNTEIGTRLGQYLAGRSGTAQAYFFGPTQMWFGHPMIPYLAPNVPGVDVEPDTPVLEIPVDRSRDAVFVFLPFRLGELATVQELYPGGSLRAAYGHTGDLLFATYELESPRMSP